MLIVTREMSFARDLSSRILFLEKGKVRAQVAKASIPHVPSLVEWSNDPRFSKRLRLAQLKKRQYESYRLKAAICSCSRWNVQNNRQTDPEDRKGEPKKDGCEGDPGVDFNGDMSALRLTFLRSATDAAQGRVWP
jgi:hypothetical protein